MSEFAADTVRNGGGIRGEGITFSEAPAWGGVGAGWKQLHGSFAEAGYSVEWHDFETEEDIDWSASFHPGSLEACLNLAGNGEVSAGESVLELKPLTAGFYLHGRSKLKARRIGGGRHQFVTLEFSKEFLERHLTSNEPGLHPSVAAMLSGGKRLKAAVSEPARLTSEHRQLVMSLRHPPVHTSAQRVWYHGKALEIAAALFYRPEAGAEFFCQRQKRLSQERVEKVIAILKENLEAPPPLEEIGKRVGCSHFYLSRIFTQEMGRTISAHLRDLRMERAAALLREGKFNVTQVALEVGYSSLSHFSSAFHEVYGCCPGLYPLATPAQRLAGGRQGKQS